MKVMLRKPAQCLGVPQCPQRLASAAARKASQDAGPASQGTEGPAALGAARSRVWREPPGGDGGLAKEGRDASSAGLAEGAVTQLVGLF